MKSRVAPATSGATVRNYEISMSVMTAKEFFTSTTEPTVTEFLDDIGSVRRGRLAAIVLYHVFDYFQLENGIKRESLMKDLIKKCPEFVIVRDACDASKHARLDRPAKPDRTLTTSDQVSGTSGLFNAPFGEGVFKEASEAIIVLDDGTSRPFAPIAQAVLSMWQRELNC
jgi:hypothetical protein